MGGEVHEQGETILGAGRTEARQGAVVAAVHGQDQIECREILPPHLAGAQMTDLDSAPARGGDGARVRRLADMVAVGGRGIGRHMPVQPGAAHERAEHALGGRGTADVSRAHEKNV